MPKPPDRPIGHQLRVLDLLMDGERRSTRDIAQAFDSLGRSSVYAALAMLQRNEFVEAEWVLDTARPTRAFQITPKGQAALAASRSHRRLRLAGSQTAMASSAVPLLAVGNVGSTFGVGIMIWLACGLIAVMASVLVRPFLGRVVVALYTRRYPAAAEDIRDFVAVELDLAVGPGGAVSLWLLVLRLRTIAQACAQAESRPNTATRPPQRAAVIALPSLNDDVDPVTLAVRPTSGRDSDRDARRFADLLERNILVSMPSAESWSAMQRNLAASMPSAEQLAAVQRNLAASMPSAEQLAAMQRNLAASAPSAPSAPSAEQWAAMQRKLVASMPSAQSWAGMQRNLAASMPSAQSWAAMQPNLAASVPSAEQWVAMKRNLAANIPNAAQWAAMRLNLGRGLPSTDE